MRGSGVSKCLCGQAKHSENESDAHIAADERTVVNHKKSLAEQDEEYGEIKRDVHCGSLGPLIALLEHLRQSRRVWLVMVPLVVEAKARRGVKVSRFWVDGELSSRRPGLGCR